MEFEEFFLDILRTGVIAADYIPDRNFSIVPTDFKMRIKDEGGQRQKVAEFSKKLIYPPTAGVEALRGTFADIEILFTNRTEYRGGQFFGRDDLIDLLRKARDGDQRMDITVKFSIFNKKSQRKVYEMTYDLENDHYERHGDEDFILAAHRGLESGRSN